MCSLNARLSALALAVATLLAALAANGADGVRPLFADDSLLEVSIAAPLTSLMRDRSDEEYLEGTFSYTTNDGETVNLDIKLRARGNFRLQKKNCSFPPVRLNFRKKQVEDTLFDGQDKLKLVAHCQHRRRLFDQYLLREYLAYKLFNLLTENSFRVRLMRITWSDTESDDERTRMGFVIEDDDDVADRLGLKAKRTPNLQIEDLDPVATNIVSVFQYMIGNTDFSPIKGADETDCCHNIAPMSANREPPYLPVPYDFDLSGIVDAPYAAPGEQFNIKSVRTRLYRGRCVNNALLPETIALFLAHRDEMLTTVESLDSLSSTSRRGTTRYLNAFFDEISTPDGWQSKLRGRCI